MERYVAYVGCYTYHGKSKGINIYDVDVEKGRFTKRCDLSLNNCTYLCTSPKNDYLYAVVDEGVSSFKIEKDGNLSFLNTASIRGLRGCYINCHPSGKYLAVSGYHDGKMTVLAVREDGSCGDITAEVYNKGVGSVAERNFRPHVCCSQFNNEGTFLFTVDSGIDQIRVYSFDVNYGSVELRDVIHAEMNAAPHQILFSKSERIAYVLNELKNYIVVYNYGLSKRKIPALELKQLVSTLPKNHSDASAACYMTLSSDGKHLICSNAGENTVAIYDVDSETGMLYMKNVLPISGEYPIDIRLFPDNKHLVSVNQDSNELTFFSIDYETGTLVMNGLGVQCDSPNVCLIIPTQS